jgi:DNA replication protein DnaC
MRNIFEEVLPITEDNMPRDLVDFHIERLGDMLAHSGAKETESMKAIIPVVARIMADRTEARRAEKEETKPRYNKCAKGLLLIGKVGCGKTVAMKAMSRIVRHRMVNVPELALRFASKGIEDILSDVDGLDPTIDSSRKNSIIIDDLGAEQTMKSYGSEFPIEELIMRRYVMWQNRGLLTSFATNMTGKDISERYGERILDRMCEMCERVVLNDGTLRR